MELYSNGVYTLYSDAFVEGDKRSSIIKRNKLMTADGTEISPRTTKTYPMVYSGRPMLDVMYQIALTDHEKCIIDNKTYMFGLSAKLIPKEKKEEYMPDGEVFWVGYGFNTFVYTRDTAFSSFLGTSYILPDIVKNHLGYTRNLRKKMGLKVSRGHDIPLPGVDVEELDCTEWELSALYNENSFTRRTDDIVWVLGYWEQLKVSGDKADLVYLYNEFKYFDEHYYKFFLDKTDGLYWGQATFIDIGGTGYPDYTETQSVMIKALSTNCLYVGGFDIMEKVCAQMGFHDEAQSFARRRDYLKKAIRENFLCDDGYYVYFLKEDGSKEEKREAIGSALLVLFDVLPESEYTAALGGYMGGPYGRPCFWPFYPGERCYHNRSTWMFSDTLFALAEYKAGNKQKAIMEAFAKACRYSLTGNFVEVLEYETGEFIGCPNYIWSAASYLAIIFRMIAGIETDFGGEVRFRPVLPKELGERFSIEGLIINGMNINLYLYGNGEKAAKTMINGRPADEAAVSGAKGAYDIEIWLS